MLEIEKLMLQNQRALLRAALNATQGLVLGDPNYARQRAIGDDCRHQINQIDAYLSTHGAGSHMVKE